MRTMKRLLLKEKDNGDYTGAFYETPKTERTLITIQQQILKTTRQVYVSLEDLETIINNYKNDIEV